MGRATSLLVRQADSYPLICGTFPRLASLSNYFRTYGYARHYSPSQSQQLHQQLMCRHIPDGPLVFGRAALLMGWVGSLPAWLLEVADYAAVALELSPLAARPGVFPYRTRRCPYADSLFRDADHLNRAGAQAYSQRLNWAIRAAEAAAPPN